MHIWTHLTPEAEGKTGIGVYPDGMVEHDGQVGELLNKLDELRIADNTIVIYTTDNGAEVMSWPDGGTTPFRGEKNTNWEGGYRVPAMVRWPGLVKPGHEINDVFSRRGLDADPAGRGRRARPQGQAAGGRARSATKTFKVHLDGYDQRNLLANGERRRRARSSSTGPTTATWPACATTSGSSSSWSSAPTASTSGRTRW